MNRRSLVIVVAAGLAAVALMVAVLILPKAAQVRSRQQEIAKAKQEQSGLQTQLAGLKADAQQASAYRKQFSKLQKQVPPTADLPGLIRMVNGAADQAGVDFIAIAPGQPALQPNGQVSPIATQITVSGGYFAVDQFLFQLENLSRISKVTTIQVTPGTGTDASNLQVLMTAEFYTTDASAGPGSAPGHQSGTSTGSATLPTNPTPTPGSSP